MEIIDMITSGTTEREKAKELGIPQTTLSSRKKKLLAKLRADLKDFSDLR